MMNQHFDVVETGAERRRFAVLDSESRLPVAYAATREGAEDLADRLERDGLPERHVVERLRTDDVRVTGA